MPAIAAITLKDNAAADVVFGPQGTDQSGVTLYLTSDSIFDAKKKLSTSLTLPKAGGQVARLKQKIVIPVMDTVDASLKVGEIIGSIEVVMPKQATSTQRLDMRKHLSTLLDHAVDTAAFTSLESVY